jgi:hypothetical protein
VRLAQNGATTYLPTTYLRLMTTLGIYRPALAMAPVRRDVM